MPADFQPVGADGDAVASFFAEQAGHAGAPVVEHQLRQS
jgi:hypothetical protein